MIDLRSDTLSLPTDAMKQAMAEAELGDDVYGEDPSVRALEEQTADLLGKEAAVFMPTGTMSNQIGLRLHTRPGDQVLIESTAHMFLLEGGTPAVLSGVTLRPLPGARGMLTASQIETSLPTPHPFMVKTVLSPITAICIENTHNLAGGTVWTLEDIVAVTDAARNHGLATHLDGARLWNASAATGVPESRYAAHFDTVSVCFSKGLGAPVGSALAGSATLIETARRFRQNIGGGLRQSGSLAAAAAYAIEHHRERLVEDHRNARCLARGLARIPGIRLDPEAVETNIVSFAVDGVASGAFATECFERGVHMIPVAADKMRAVTWMGVTADDIDRAIERIREAMPSPA